MRDSVNLPDAVQLRVGQGTKTPTSGRGMGITATLRRSRRRTSANSAVLAWVLCELSFPLVPIAM
jgi:hypothetical protein